MLTDILRYDYDYSLLDIKGPFVDLHHKAETPTQ